MSLFCDETDKKSEVLVSKKLVSCIKKVSFIKKSEVDSKKSNFSKTKCKMLTISVQFHAECGKKLKTLLHVSKSNSQILRVSKLDV